MKSPDETHANTKTQIDCEIFRGTPGQPQPRLNVKSAGEIPDRPKPRLTVKPADEIPDQPKLD